VAARAAPAPVRRARVALVLGCWLAAAGLVLGQLLILRHLSELDRSIARTSAHILIPSEGWRVRGTLLPLLLILAALTMQNFWLKGAWRLLSAILTSLFLPCALVCLLLADLCGTASIQTVVLSDGRRFTVGEAPLLTDADFTLYEDADPAGLVWRQVSWLDDPDDNRFGGLDHLVVSQDEHWLLVTRAGLWTDCFRLVSGRPVRIDVQPNPFAPSPHFEADMRLRSQRIAALTGLRL
jgi:hypothetical protein